MSQQRPPIRFKDISWNPFLAALGLLITWQTAVRADDLLKLVDADVAICVQVRNLSKHATQLESFEFTNRLVNAPFFTKWKASPEFKQLQDAKKTFEATTGTPIRKSLDEIIGQEFVVSVRMTVGAQPTAVFMTRMSAASNVEKWLEAWNRFQPQTRTKLTYRDASYTKSVVDNNGPAKAYFYVEFGNVLAVSKTESMIRRVIELHTSPDTESSLNELDSAQDALKRRDENEVGSFYVNPRAFSQFDVFVPSELRDYWRRMQWLSFRLNQFDDEVQLDFLVDYDNSSMPEWWTQLVKETSQHKLPLDRIPSNALVTVSGHFSSQSIASLVKRALAKDGLPDELKPVRRAVSGLLLGMDPVDDVLPMIGPTWTFFAVPRDAGKSKSFPSDALLAVALKDVKGDDDEKRKSRQEGLHNALNTGLNFLTLIHNTKSTKDVSLIRKKTSNGVTIRYADPVAMFQPAYAITDGYLVLATSPQLCADFLADPADPRVASKNGVHLARRALDAEAQLLFTNTKSIREMLKAHQDWFVWQAGQDKIDAAAAQSRLQSMDEFLQLIDGSYVSFGVKASSLRLSWGVIAVAK